MFHSANPKAMKTLIFCAGAPNPDLSVLQHIVPDVLVGVDGGAATLAAHGFAPHWAIGDFDTAPPPQTSRRILRLPAEKDDTDLEYALVRVLQDFAPEEVREVIILGALGGGGRADHFLCNVWLAHQPRFAAWLDKIRFCERRGSLRFLRAGSHRLFPESGMKYLSFIGLTPVAALTLEGVKYPLHRRSFAYPPALVSNEFAAETAQVSFDSGLLCAMQTAD